MKRVLQRMAGALLAAVMALSLVPMGRAEATSPPGDIVNQKDLPASLAGGYSETAGEYEIYPVPHSVVYEDKAAAERTHITLASQVNVVIGEGVDEATKTYLKEITDAYGLTWSQSRAIDPNKTNILLGIYGKTGDLAAQQCGEPQQYDDLFTKAEEVVDGKYEPYILKVTAEGNTHGIIAVSGLDTTAVYRGVGTIAMLFSSFAGKYLVPVTIEDYSNDIIRGFIEGFYGDFTYEARANQMKAIRTVKGNMYVFASKTDKYHGSGWAEKYPEKELGEIQNLVEIGKKYKVDYAWSVHLGLANFFEGSGSGNQRVFNASPTRNEAKYLENLKKLEDKFDQLYGIGVRNFHILNDDANSGSYADAARLVKDIAAWLDKKQDCGPLVYCCNGYNTADQGQKQELETFRDVPENVYFYWTGAGVNSPVEQRNLDVVYNKSEHYAVTWLNYPCSEHAKSGLFLGDLEHYMKQADKVTGQAGFVSNPTDYPEANLVAYFQLLSWSWNRDNYASYMTELWENCFKYLRTEVWKSYQIIARNVSNCPNSSRVAAGFKESEYLADTIDAVKAAVQSGEDITQNPQYAELLEKFAEIRAAVADIRGNCASKELKTELEPWLKSLVSVVNSAETALSASIAFAREKYDLAISKLSVAVSQLETWDDNRVSNMDFNDDVMAKAGSKRIQPFAAAVIDYLSAGLSKALGLGKDAATGEKRFIGQLNEHDISGPLTDPEIKKMFDGNEDTYAGWQNHSLATIGDYYGVDLGSVQVVTGIYIHQSREEKNTGDYFRKARVQYSENGTDWVDLTSTLDTQIFNLTGLSIRARYVRLYRTELDPNKAYYYTYAREFRVTVDERTAAVFTNASGVEASVTENGTSYTLMGGNVTLKPGDYVGLEFTKLAEVASAEASTLPEGLKVYVSHTPEAWSEMGSGTAAAKYVVIKNDGQKIYDGPLPQLDVTVALPLQEPKLAAAKVLGQETVSSNLTGNWGNLFDGDLTTVAGTDVKNGLNGDYMIFDLGAAIRLDSIVLVVPDSGTDFPDAAGRLKVWVGNSLNGNWDDYGQVDLKTDLEHMGYKVSNHRAQQGDSKTARYIKIGHIQNAANKVKINEIEINGRSGVAAPTSAFSGDPKMDFNALTDGSLSTAVNFGKIGSGGGSLEYLISENNHVTDIKIIQDASHICMAPVQYQTPDGGWHDAGKLDTVVSTLHVGKIITALRIKWPAGSTPSISEIIVEGTGSGVSAAAAPLEVPDIQSGTISAADITVNYGTPAEMVGLPVQAHATLTSGKDVVLPLKWSCANYNPKAPRTYTFTGTYDTSELELNNSTGLSATATVEVLAQNTAPAAAAAEPVAEPATESVVEPADEPMALASTATAPAMPEGSVDLIGNAGGEDFGRKVYVSGREDNSHPASKMVDGVLDENADSSTNRWCSNATKKPNNENPPSWMVIDLGEKVTDITLVEIHFHKKVWPTKFKIQVSDEWSPVDYYDINGKTIKEWQNNSAFTGDNAGDAECWETIYEIADHTETEDYPIHTVTKDGGEGHQFTAEHISTPVIGRYLRVLFEEINGKAAGDCISVKEIYVYGTRASSSDTPEQPSEPIDLLGNGEEAVSADRVYVSGCETGTEAQGKASAVDHKEASHWSSNKQRENNTSPQDCPAWIVVDLGDGVTDITKVELKFNNMVWPKGFAIQVSDSWEPQDFSQRNIGHVSNENEAFTGQNAKDNDCWTTVFSIESHTEGNGPRHIVSKTDDKGDRFLEGYLTNPIKGKYLRVYFDTVNEKAGGNSIGLQEIYVYGTRAATEEPDPVEPPAPGPSEPVNTEIKAATEVEATAVKGHVSEAELPQKVNVSLEDDTTVTLPVTWNLEEIAEQSGSVKVTGTIDTGAGCESYTVTNGKDIPATLNLTIIDVPTATAVLVNPNSRTVWAGTGFDALRLPARVTVQLSNGMVAVAEASWNKDSYAPDQAGDQTVTGSMTISDGEYRGVVLNGLDLKFPVTVKGLNTPKQITVNFETDGGDQIESQTLSYGGTLASLPQPGPKDGRAFEGWYLDAGFRTKWDNRNLYFSTTLYAKFAGGEEKLPDVQVQSGGTTGKVDGLDETVTEAVESAVKSTGFGEGAADAVSDVVQGKADGIVESLGENEAEWKRIQETLEAGPEDINIFAGAYLDITVGADGYKAGGTSYTLDITPRYYVVATTADDVKDIEVGQNAVKLTGNGTDELADLKNVAVEIALPAGFAEKGQTVYVFPEGENAKYETCTVREDGKVVYTAPHFSKFTVTRERPYTAPDPGPVVPPTPSTPPTPGETSPSAKFTDVNQKGWYIKSINYVLEKGLMNGVSDTKFAPDDDLTRAQLVTVLYRLAGEPAAAAASFTDVKDEWFAEAIAWAAANEIVTGYGNGKFGPDDPVTREQAAAILYRYAKYKKYDAAATGSLDGYTDAGSVDKYAQDAMKWCNGHGIITGKTATTLAPRGTAIRAEVATILERFCKNIVK